MRTYFVWLVPSFLLGQVLNKLRKVRIIIKMEIIVVFDSIYHLLPVAFWFCILFVCSIVTLNFAVEKHSEDR